MSGKETINDKSFSFAKSRSFFSEKKSDTAEKKPNTVISTSIRVSKLADSINEKIKSIEDKIKQENFALEKCKAGYLMRVKKLSDTEEDLYKIRCEISKIESNRRIFIAKKKQVNEQLEVINEKIDQTKLFIKNEDKNINEILNLLSEEEKSEIYLLEKSILSVVQEKTLLTSKLDLDLEEVVSSWLINISFEEIKASISNFINANKDINIIDSKGNTLLYYAIINSVDINILEYLLINGADPDIKDFDGDNMISFAENEIVEELLKKFSKEIKQELDYRLAN